MSGGDAQVEARLVKVALLIVRLGVGPVLGHVDLQVRGRQSKPVYETLGVKTETHLADVEPQLRVRQEAEKPPLRQGETGSRK